MLLGLSKNVDALMPILHVEEFEQHGVGGGVGGPKRKESNYHFSVINKEDVLNYQECLRGYSLNSD